MRRYIYDPPNLRIQNDESAASEVLKVVSKCRHYPTDSRRKLHSDQEGGEAEGGTNRSLFSVYLQ